MLRFVTNRDLAVVFNGQTERSDMIFTNGKTTLLLPREEKDSAATSSKCSAVAVTTTGKAAWIAQGGKVSVSVVGLMLVQHLCEQVDCNKPLFGK